MAGLLLATPGVAAAAPTATPTPAKTSGRKDSTTPPPVIFTPTPTASKLVSPTVTPTPSATVGPDEQPRAAGAPSPQTTPESAPDGPADSSGASGLAALRATDSNGASGLAALRATLTAVPITDAATEVDPAQLEAIARGCDVPIASGNGAPASRSLLREPAPGQAAVDSCGRADAVEVAVQQRAVELGVAKILPTVDLSEYADRLARLNSWLVSPFAETALTSSMVRFGYLGDYGAELAFEVRGEQGVALMGTRHYGLDLQIPWLPDGGRGSPVVAPFAGRIIRTADPVGGPFGIWLENRELNLRARLMHMDGLVVGIETGTWAQAGQQIGIVGAQGTEGFPHLHLAFERLSDAARMNPALFYRIRDWSDAATYGGTWYDDPSNAPAVAFRPGQLASLISDGEGRLKARPVIVAALGLDGPLPTRMLASLWGPVELPYP